MAAWDAAPPNWWSSSPDRAVQYERLAAEQLQVVATMERDRTALYLGYPSTAALLVAELKVDREYAGELVRQAMARHPEPPRQ